MTRPDYPPGTIIEHRQRFVVRADRYGQHARKHAGARKLRRIGEHEVVEVAGRWKVRQSPPGRWIASRRGPDWTELIAFPSHAAAIAWADRTARQETR